MKYGIDYWDEISSFNDTYQYHEQSRNIQEEKAGSIRPRWIPMCVLQAYRLTDVRPYPTKITSFLASRYAGKSARLKELSDLLSELQFISAERYRERLLFGREHPYWRKLEDDMVASLGSEKKETK